MRKAATVKVASLLILVLSHSGYWIGGREAAIHVRWAAREPVPAVVQWQLRYGDAVLESGRWRLEGEPAERTLKLQLPEVRVRTPLQLVWEAQSNDGEAAVIGHGSTDIQLFPPDLLSPLSVLLKDTPLYVLDAPEGLPRALDAAGVRYQRIEAAAQAMLIRKGILLVGEDHLSGTMLPGQTPLLDAARRGVRVLLFHQSHPERLAGLEVVERVVPEHYDWRKKHPLLRSFTRADLGSWRSDGGTVRAVRMPADAPAVMIAAWPADSAAGPTDAAAVALSVGRGRIVFWQLPLGSFVEDPRSQILLVNAIGYLVGHAEPAEPRLEPNGMNHTDQGTAHRSSASTGVRP